MEKHILALETSPNGIYDNDNLEEKALELAIDEIYQTNGQKWKPWASNARSIRIGDIILIVDSDTIVPEVCHACIDNDLIWNFTAQDCFRDAARELAACPEVAIIQHESGKALAYIALHNASSASYRCHTSCPPLL